MWLRHASPSQLASSTKKINTIILAPACTRAQLNMSQSVISKLNEPLLVVDSCFPCCPLWPFVSDPHFFSLDSGGRLKNAPALVSHAEKNIISLWGTSNTPPSQGATFQAALPSTVFCSSFLSSSLHSPWVLGQATLHAVSQHPALNEKKPLKIH